MGRRIFFGLAGTLILLGSGLACLLGRGWQARRRPAGLYSRVSSLNLTLVARPR